VTLQLVGAHVGRAAALDAHTATGTLARHVVLVPGWGRVRVRVRVRVWVRVRVRVRVRIRVRVRVRLVRVRLVNGLGWFGFGLF